MTNQQKIKKVVIILLIFSSFYLLLNAVFRKSTSWKDFPTVYYNFLNNWTNVLKGQVTTLQTLRELKATPTIIQRLKATAEEKVQKKTAMFNSKLFTYDPIKPLRTWKRQMYERIESGAGYINNSTAMPPEAFRNEFTGEDYECVLSLFDQFVSVCEKFDIPFTFHFGTLIGSYRRHGIIPWDYDFDVMINISHLSRFVSAFNTTEGLELRDTPRQAYLELRNFDIDVKKQRIHSTHMKVYKLPDGSQSVRLHSWFTWPFVDIFLFDENNTHICDVTWARRSCWEKERFFPLKLRPFEDRLLPVPADTEYVLTQQKIGDWDVCKAERGHIMKPVKSGETDCKELTDFYPFVDRRKRDGVLEEMLVANDTVLNSFTEKYLWSWKWPGKLTRVDIWLAPSW